MSKKKDLALITALIIDEDILGGSVFQTFDLAYLIAEKFQYIYPHNFKLEMYDEIWEVEDLDFHEAVILFAKQKLYYMEIKNNNLEINLNNKT